MNVNKFMHDLTAYNSHVNLTYYTEAFFLLCANFNASIVAFPG